MLDTCNTLVFTDAAKIEEAVNEARKQAIFNLKKRVFEEGCDAVVALDVDFANVDSHGALRASVDSHYIIVCANGTGVNIEPIEG